MGHFNFIENNSKITKTKPYTKENKTTEAYLAPCQT